MTAADCVCVCVIALVASLVSEAINWFLVYRTPQFKKLKADIEKKQREVEKMENDATPQAKRLEQAKKDVKELQQNLSMLRMRTTVAMMFTMFAVHSVLNSMYGGIVIAKLPFTPFTLLQKLTKRGLNTDDPTDCSVTGLYVLTSLAIRGSVQKLLGHEMPRGSQPSMFDVPQPDR